MRLFKVITVLLILCLGCSACDSTSNNLHSITLSSREIFDENEDTAKVHIDFLRSEYIEFNYSGDKHFDLELEIWENGEVTGTIHKLHDINGSKIKGVSLAVNPYKDEGYTTIIGIYYDDGYESSKFTVSEPIAMLSGRVESTIREKKTFSDSEEIGLWGFHCFDSEFQVFEDSFAAAKDMEWSIVAVLRPLD